MTYFKDYIECPEPYARRPLPNYEVKPLKQDHIAVCAMQMDTRPIDAGNPEPGVRANVEHLCEMVEGAMMWPTIAPKQLFCFPEFCLTGLDYAWTRKQWLRISIDLEGEELKCIGRTAKALGCHIALACHIREQDWPDHYFSASVIVGPQGTVIHKHWKAIRDPGRLEYATTVHDVLDEFVERYGWDAVWPVARTEIGNIATYVCSEGFQPETARVFAFKGAEILVRLIAAGGYNYSETPGIGDSRITMRAQCIENHCYGIYANSGSWAPQWISNAMGGSSMIIDPNGNVLKEATSAHETVVGEVIPIAAFRSRHSIPNLRKELYAPAYAQYEGKYPPNMFSEYLPEDAVDAIKYVRRKARW